MLNYLTLNNKPTVTRIGPSGNEEYQIDLMSHVIDNVDINAVDILVVNKYYVARPDLIALACYGNDKYGDIICKYNGISNPFEMNEGDVLYIPDISDISLMFTNEKKASDFIDSTKSNNSMIEKEHKFQKDKNEKRSPAQQTVGESNYVIDKSIGVVFY